MINNSEIQEQTIKQQINIDTIIERFNQRYIIKKESMRLFVFLLRFVVYLLFFIQYM